MSNKRYILIYLIFATAQESKIAADWVEIPQFSDEAKVYRVPYTKYVRGEKYFLENQDGPAFHSFRNTSSLNDGFRRIKIHEQTTTDSSIKSSLNNENWPSISVTTETIYKFQNTESSVTEGPQIAQDFSEDTIFDDEAATVEAEDEDVRLPTNSFSDEIVIDKDQPYQSVPTAVRPQETEKFEEEDDTKTNFLAYIPMELFKKVHATLKSQPSTVKGKLGFLKRFEMTLLAEIEKRLVPVISPVRKKRESRGDHGWDEHDDSLGFPSLEGTLMAISFLTFAVYLVQLVMLLFRNLGNQQNNIPVAPTFLVNRNKRSVEEFTEHTARVFDYLDKFAKSQFIEN